MARRYRCAQARRCGAKEGPVTPSEKFAARHANDFEHRPPLYVQTTALAALGAQPVPIVEANGVAEEDCGKHACVLSNDRARLAHTALLATRL